jgi:hypothetical protein
MPVARDGCAGSGPGGRAGAPLNASIVRNSCACVDPALWILTIVLAAFRRQRERERPVVKIGLFPGRVRMEAIGGTRPQSPNGVVSFVSFVSTTNTARSLAGFVLLAFALTP